MTFKKILLCSAVALVIATPAFAKTKAIDTTSIIEGPDQWTGLYLGAIVGGAFGTTNKIDQMGSPAGTQTQGGVTGGLDFGYDYEINNFVLGIETDISGSSFKADNMCTDITAHRCGMDQEWFATLRPRLGYAVENFLPYATGGAAVGAVHTTRYQFSTNSLVNDQSDVQVGYTVGGGLEYMLTRNWSAKAEYLYTKYADTSAPPYGAGTIGYSVPLSEHIVRCGVNYKF